MEIYQQLKTYLMEKIEEHQLTGNALKITCKALSAKEAIGTPDHDDYPIQKGKEVMVEADFKGSKGQAFTDHFEQNSYKVEQLANLELSSNAKRASFVAGLNAVMRHLELSEKTVHCRNQEPVECASHLFEKLNPKHKIALIGLQPRFLEKLSKHEVRVVDLDQENIGKTVSGIKIEGPEMNEVVDWCDQIFATGSTLTNATIETILKWKKPVTFYGVTISGASKILGLNTYCHCGH